MEQTKQQPQSILGLPLNELIHEFLKAGFSKLDAKRVFPWIHTKLTMSFDEMSDVPKQVRTNLPKFFSLDRPVCKILQESSDGTAKALLEFSDGNCVETVFIPDERRNTICISSQVGCLIGCKFCNTGTQQFRRNLTSSEIMAQIIYWIERQKHLGKSPITNIVFMGMGEPLLNSKNLFATLEILLSKKTYDFSRNKITISTSGIITEAITDLAKFGVKLAISLHAPNDKIRNELMPINKAYNIETLINAIKEYYSKTNRRVTIEYVMLKDVNDSLDDAKKLADLLKGLNVYVNLIPYNETNHIEFKKTDKNKILKFGAYLQEKNITVTIRKEFGSSIDAACGQLRSKEVER